MAAGEHVGRGLQQAEVGLQAGEVVVEGGDLAGGGVVEPVEFDQVEAALGLGGCQAVDAGVLGRRQYPLALLRVPAALAQEGRSRGCRPR
ncbi:hypothetical protein [Streptomyces sp. NPDC056701]|uniref:hypothetical protein n=1 Tax=Streptomyces sp. NPDC056701 TaxID=3345916 RepID=UPI0036B4BBCD